MWLPFFILRLAASSLVLDGIRYPADGQVRRGMLRELGDLWNPSEPGSNIIPCGDWGAQGSRLQVALGDTFVIQGSVPLAEGGGVLTADAIFDPSPNFNMAGRLYRSTRFAVEDISDKPTNFSLSIVLPRTAAPGPFSIQVKFVALVARYAFFQCADLNGYDPSARESFNAVSWWVAAIVILAVGAILAICLYCIYCKKCCSKQAKPEPIDGRSLAPESPLGYPTHVGDNNVEVSLKDQDREPSDSLEIEDMAQSESEDISDDEASVRRK